MIDRLEQYGVLESVQVKGESAWQFASRNAYIIDSAQSLTMGVVIDIANAEDDWIRYMSLVLAACTEGYDCGLQCQGGQWVLWMYYEGRLDDDELNQSLLFHQALAMFLEKENSDFGNHVMNATRG